REGQGHPVLWAARCRLAACRAAAGGQGQLVDPHPRGGPGGAEGVAADRAGVAADVRAVAQPDREAVAVAAAGRAEAASPGGGLARPARPGGLISEPNRGRFSKLSPLSGAFWPGEAGPGPSGPPGLHDLESQNSSGESTRLFRLRRLLPPFLGLQELDQLPELLDQFRRLVSILLRRFPGRPVLRPALGVCLSRELVDKLMVFDQFFQL